MCVSVYIQDLVVEAEATPKPVFTPRRGFRSGHPSLLRDAARIQFAGSKKEELRNNRYTPVSARHGGLLTASS